MKKTLRLIVVLVLAVSMLAMNAGAITILHQSTEDALVKSGWTIGTVGFQKALDEPMDISGMDNIYIRIYVSNFTRLLPF